MIQPKVLTCWLVLLFIWYLYLYNHLYNFCSFITYHISVHVFYLFIWFFQLLIISFWWPVIVYLWCPLYWSIVYISINSKNCVLSHFVILHMIPEKSKVGCGWIAQICKKCWPIFCSFCIYSLYVCCIIYHFVYLWL